MPKLTRSEIGRLGAAARAKKLGPGGMAEIGRRGGEATKARHGLEHYRAIAPEGGEATRLLIERGKALEEAEDA